MSLISESKENFPILIVDRTGIVGNELAKKLSQDSTIVLVTEKQPLDLENIIHIPFERKIPKVPDNTYSHIFVIDDGQESTIESLPSFLRKAQEDKAIFCFCTTFKNQGEIPSEIFEYKRSKVTFLGDIFPPFGFFPKSYVNRFLITSRERGRIGIPQDGMAISYPVFFEDAILGILEASFGTSSEKIYYLFPKHGITLLSLALIIQKSDPNIKIDFTDEKEESTTSITREGKYLLPENYPLEERVRNLKVHKNIFEGQETLVSPTAFPFGNFRIILFAILFFLFLPLITTLFFSYLGSLSLDKAKTSLDNSRPFVFISKSSFDLANSFSKPLLYETEFFKSDLLTNLVQSIEKGIIQSESISEYHNAMDFFSEGKTSEGISHLRNFLLFAQAENKLKIFDDNLFNFISQTINVWPQALAVDSKKTYLILFQNNLVLRPTGGLIQSFGLLTFDNGKISDFAIYKTSDSDKNLKGHVEPPFAIRRYFPSTHWFLKDSNFNPDFKEAAVSSSFFADLETGKKVDGVIALDLNSIQKLLELTEDKSSNNFFETAKTKVNDQNYLGEVISSLVRNLKKKNLARIFLSKEFADMVVKKDIIFAFNDQNIENVFAANNFSSSLIDNRSDSPKKINDFVGISETNFGEGANLIKRKIIQKVILNENGEISSNIILEFKNSGDSDYKNYLRFITPLGSSLRKIKVDGNETDFTDAIIDPSVYEAKDFIAPKALEVEKYNQSSKAFFGFLTIIPKGKTQIIEATFSLESKPPLSTFSEFSYNLHFFKQPSVEPYPFNLSVSHPSFFKTSSNSFSTKVDKDFDLTFDFSQK